MSPQPIRFFHRGRLVEVHDAPVTRTVLDWLREDARCTGTKEGCNEGDCGACTVVIGELPEHTDAGAAAPGTVVRGLSLRTVNACIRFLPTLHGKALFTVEDLRRIAQGADTTAAVTAISATGARPPGGGPLHPVQRAMVDCHASQCGFCTPGFVMSLYAAYEHALAGGARPSRQQLADELSGNLCRCTGYRPILDAGQRMFDLPPQRLDTTPVIDALRALHADETFHYAAPNPHDPAAAPDHYHAPRTLDALAALREQLPDARLLAGSTDIGLWVNKAQRALGDLIYVGDVDALKRVETLPDGTLRIGAAASLETAWRALAQRHPALTDVWLRFASPPVRNAGTMGGNVANGSPIGDSAPVLIALDARIELRRGAHVRELALADFYVDYMKNRLERGEFVQALQVPPPAAGLQVRAYKISKRFDCDISAVCVGAALRVEQGLVRDARLAFGGMAATVRLAARVQAALVGQPWEEDTVRAAMDALAEDFQPLTDMRGSAAYRLQVARNLLMRLWLETRPHEPLPAQATSVFATLPHAALGRADAPAVIATVPGELP